MKWIYISYIIFNSIHNSVIKQNNRESQRCIQGGQKNLDAKIIYRVGSQFYMNAYDTARTRKIFACYDCRNIAFSSIKNTCCFAKSGTLKCPTC